MGEWIRWVIRWVGRVGGLIGWVDRVANRVI